MSMQAARLAPASEGMEMVEMLDAQTEIQRDILRETIDSGLAGTILESGRTLCGSPDSVRGPLARLPTAVELSECPIGRSGAVHTHVTESELRSPQNSIIDVAIVAFESLDVIGVVGTDTAEYFVAATDEREMQDRFRAAVGHDVRSVADVQDALPRIDVGKAESNLRSELAPLFQRRPTGFETLAEGIPKIDAPTLPASSAYALREIGVYASDHGIAPTVLQQHRTQVHSCTRKAESMTAQVLPPDFAVSNVALGAAVGTAVGTLTERLLFD